MKLAPTLLAAITVQSACVEQGRTPGPQPTEKDQTGTTGTTGTPGTTGATTFCEVQRVFDQNCVQCHSVPGGLSATMDLQVGAYDSLVNQPSAYWTDLRVSPGQAEASLLYLKVAGEQGDQGDSMPLGGALDSESIGIIQDWITAGALADACASTDTGETDTGETDTGETDTGGTDTGETDTGETDTGGTDTGGTGPWDLRLTGSAWSSVHTGETFSLNVVRAWDGLVVASQSVTITEDTLSFEFAGLLDDGQDYALDYYADHNANGSCEPVPGDHVWHQPIGPVWGDIDARIDHDGSSLDSAGCDSF